MTGDITRLSAAALSRAIHLRQVSCLSVMEAYLDRIDSLNPAVNAIVFRRPSTQLLEEARACDRELEGVARADGCTGSPRR